MDRRKFSFSLVAAAVLAGCGGGGGDAGNGDAGSGALEPQLPVTPGAPGAPELATATSLPASTVFPQTMGQTDTGSVAPGQANWFELARDFSVEDGGDDQFDSALELSVTVGGSTVAFPGDQLYAELTPLGPELGTADGVKTVSITTDTQWNSANGTAWALFHPHADARIQQTLDLGSAAGNAVNCTWGGTDASGRFLFPDQPFYFQVVLRDGTGALLTTLYRQDEVGISGTWGSASLSAFAGQVVVLSFEQRCWYGPYNSSRTLIDDVSVVDSVTGTQFVVNGDFESGASGWTVPESRAASGVRSGDRILPGVGTVQRTFFSQPNALWARITDVFTNTSGAALQATVGYGSNLGSDGGGIIYATPAAPQKALTAWDGRQSDRDVGFVFGSADVVNFQSASAPGSNDGNDNVEVSFNIDVPAGGSVTLINFVLMGGTDTGSTAVDASARATEIDTIAADIANNFRTNFAYQRGLTQAQLDTLKNF